MSPVFVSATKCAALSKQDVLLKKMLYFYLRGSARQDPSLALLVVQHLLNDCSDADAGVRGSALRSLVGLRSEETAEAALGAVRRGLADPSGYVRGVAAVAALRLWSAREAGGPRALRDAGVVDEIWKLLGSDADAQVVADCLRFLRETGELARRGPPSRALTVGLLNHVRDFDEWAQCLVLEVVADYTPASVSERDDVLDVLDFSIDSPSAGVAAAGLHAFLRLTEGDARARARLLRRLAAPAAVAVASREPEIAHARLAMLLPLAKRDPAPFRPLAASALRVRPGDPSYLRNLKIALYEILACSENALDVADELSAYARDADEGLARRAARALARVAERAPGAAGVADRLLALAEAEDRPDVLGAALEALAEVLRAMPGAAPAIAPLAAAAAAGAALEGAAPRAALARLLGEHAESVPEAPYLLEDMVLGPPELREDAAGAGAGAAQAPPQEGGLLDLADLDGAAPNGAAAGAALSGLLGLDGGAADGAPAAAPSARAPARPLPPPSRFFLVEDPSTQEALVTATARAFLARPPEARPALEVALRSADVSPHPGVRARARAVRRVLASGEARARDFLLARPPAPEPGADGRGAERDDRVLDEIDSLSPLYGIPADALGAASRGEGDEGDGEDELEGGGHVEDDHILGGGAGGADAGLELLGDAESVADETGSVAGGLPPTPTASSDAVPDLLSGF